MTEATETNFDEFKGKDCVSKAYTSFVLYLKVFKTDLYLYLNMYGLLTKCEVKMSGYWPRSFFVCFMDRDGSSQGP